MIYTLKIYSFYFKNKIDLASPPQKKINKKQPNTELTVLIKWKLEVAPE